MVDINGLSLLIKNATNISRNVFDQESTMLLFLFYKTASDRYEAELEQYGLPPEEYDDLMAPIHFYDKEKGELLTWKYRTTPDKISELPDTFIRIERLNNGRLKGISELWRSTRINIANTAHRERLIKLIEEFNKYNFTKYSFDVLGTAYEMILKNFMPQKAKEGEIYTPREVIDLMLELIKPDPDAVILDPAAGTGGMLIIVHEYFKKNNLKAKTGGIHFIGQEINSVTAAIGRMNLLMHGIHKFRYYNGDSLLEPSFDDDVQKKKVQIITNPPWNLKGYDEKTLKKSKVSEAYRFGYTTKSSADWAWMQLVLHYMTDRSAVIFDQGLLFRGGREAKIRQKFLEGDVIEAVILLPENLFINTTAAGIVVVLNKDKPEDRKGKVLFIDLSEYYRKHPDIGNKNQLTREGIDKAVEIFENWKSVDGVSRVVSIDEIREYDWNMNVRLYVRKPREEERINIPEVLEELRKTEEEIQKSMKEVFDFTQKVAEVWGE